MTPGLLGSLNYPLFLEVATIIDKVFIEPFVVVLELWNCRGKITDRL